MKNDKVVMKKQDIMPLVLSMELVMAFDEFEGTNAYKNKLKAVCNSCKKEMEKFVEKTHNRYKDIPNASADYSTIQTNFSRIIDNITIEDLLKPLE